MHDLKHKRVDACIACRDPGYRQTNNGTLPASPLLSFHEPECGPWCVSFFVSFFQTDVLILGMQFSISNPLFSDKFHCHISE